MSFPRYAKYKDSGVEWLGEVPDHWSLRPLMRLTPDSRQIMYGIVLPGPHVEDGVPIVKGGDVSNERLDPDTLNRTTREIESGYVRSRLRGGDIVYAFRGSIGEAAIVPESLTGANLTQDAARIAPRADIDVRWLLFAMRSQGVFAQLEQTVNGATIRGINIFQLKRARIPTPPPAEQTLIAEFLDRETAKIDALVGEQRRLIQLLKEKRQAVIFHAVTKGLNPHAPMKPSGIEWLGDVPEHWELTRLANLFREMAEPGIDDLPVLSVSIHHGVSDTELDEEELDRKVTRSDDRSKYKRVLPGDLVYNMMRAWQGGFGTGPARTVGNPGNV
jgi:type I restriction enzyme, S subunit